MDKITWLKKEVDGWKTDGIVNDTQAKQIVSRYPAAESSRAITVMGTIGAILIGLGALLLVSSNWQDLGSVAKLLILFGTTGALFYAGYELLYRREKLPLLGQSLLFLGSFMVGVTLAQTAQIFHVEANAYWIYGLWLVAILPLAYTFKNRNILALSLILLLPFLGGLIHQEVGVFTFFEGMLEGFTAFLFLGLTLFGIGFLHDNTSFSKFSSTLKSWGIFYTFIVIFSVIVSELEILDEYRLTHSLTYLFVVLAALTIGMVTYRFFIDHKHRYTMIWLSTAFVTALLIWFLGMSLDGGDIHKWYGFGQNSFTSAFYLFAHIFINILNLVLIVFMVLLGYHEQKASLINTAVFFFVIHLVYIYFTTLYAYMDKSLFLIIGGVILVGGGYYLEKQRRALIAHIQ